MTSWYELRAFDLERFQAMRPDLDAYVRGEVRPPIRDAAARAIQALSACKELADSPMLDVYLRSLQNIRDAKGQPGNPASVPAITSLLTIGFTVPFEGAPSVDRCEDPHCVHLGKNWHTTLYMATILASPWIYDLLNWLHGAIWPEVDPRTSQHRQVTILNREEVQQFLRELHAVQEVPEWVAECTWGNSERQFARLLGLVRHVANSPSLSVIVDYNG